MKPLITAIRTLTIVPIPGKEASDFSESLPWFPVVGAGIACIVILLYKTGLLLYPQIPLFSAIVMLTGGVLITGALHLDGFADVADGFGGGKTRERILEIFKDSRLGTFGVTALTLDILTKVILYSFYFEHNKIGIVAISLIASRSAQSLALVFLPYAGLKPGVAAPFANGKMRLPVIIASVATVLFCMLISSIATVTVGALFAFCACLLFCIACKRTLCGITGDCIGAVNEIAELSFLIAGVFTFAL